MSHHYINGTLVPQGTPGAIPSVTTILDVRNKPFLNDWKARIGEEAAFQHTKLAQEKGTAVHEAIEANTLRGAQVATDNPIFPYFNGFLNWQTKFQPTKMKPELFLTSNLGFAGTADLICWIAGECWIVDYKTSKRFDEGMGLQLAAYRQAYYEQTGILARTGILRLTELTQKGYQFREYEGDFSVFMAHKAIYDWLNKDTVSTKSTRQLKPYVQGITI